MVLPLSFAYEVVSNSLHFLIVSVSVTSLILSVHEMPWYTITHSYQFRIGNFAGYAKGGGDTISV